MELLLLALNRVCPYGSIFYGLMVMIFTSQGQACRKNNNPAQASRLLLCPAAIFALLFRQLLVRLLPTHTSFNCGGLPGSSPERLKSNTSPTARSVILMEASPFQMRVSAFT